MNGRVYDPDLARFVSADPIIQSPFHTNSFNRYSYVMNNPMKYTDPTGYEINDEWQDIIKGNSYNPDGYDNGNDKGEGGT